MKSQYTPKGDEISEMLRKNNKDTIYYLMGMLGITIIPIFLYITH